MGLVLGAGFLGISVLASHLSRIGASTTRLGSP